MKNRIPVIPVLLLASCGVAFGSWIANLYGVGEVQSLFSVEGLRHEVECALSEYMACPELGVMLVLAPGVGMCWGSGLWDARKGRLTRRERRALNWALATALLCLGALVLAVTGPWAFLRSVTGGWWPSPFLAGLPVLLSFVLGLVGWMYGYAAGRFNRLSDIREALTRPYRRWALYPVYLFFLVRLFGQLQYTGLPEAAGASGAVSDGAFHLLAVLLFFLSCI